MKFTKELQAGLKSSKIEIMSMMEDKISFLVFAFGIFVRIAVTLIFFQALYLQVDLLAGWSLGQVYILLGTYYLIEIIAAATYLRGYHQLPDMIDNHKLDGFIVKPLNLKKFFIFHRVDFIFTIPQFIMAIGLIIYGYLQAGSSINIIYYIIMVFIGLIIHFSIYL